LEKQFIRIFNLFKNDVYRLAYSYTKNISDSDDITQNVFVKLYKHNEVLEVDDLSIKKWLFKVTINECKSLLLSSWKKKIIPFTEKEENTLYAKINDNNILDQVMQLPKKYRLVIFLYYYENYSTKEISEVLNITITNVQTMLSRAREKLKKIIREDEDE
jgi:RNA polymerase sigma-70 factor (ECF subfamily)